MYESSKLTKNEKDAKWSGKKKSGLGELIYICGVITGTIVR